MALGRGRAQVVGAPRHHGERLAVAVLHVEHPGQVPAAVGGHRAARLDPQRLAGTGQGGQPAPVGGPVEHNVRPRVVHRHAAAEVELGVRHTVLRAPLPPERDQPPGRGQQAVRADPAGQVGVQAAQPHGGG